ncbi:hypothetical protein EDC02_4047 [Micromonospora sp. Llam0]|uniref:hypothetical protein n=1 Tax=Micromonospora sp. Llam0 TaxID=2485143 RepID=UPI000FBEA6A8|nr:hypothetical protein [Micromonospora sp. Llam0]ROO62078.1 hypothetical protein EDC02_4047 [Micromonospora sp. Llam0]
MPDDDLPYEGWGNPYENATGENLRFDWSDGQADIDVDLDGMAEYAQHVVDIQKLLLDNMGSLSLLASLPGKAWEGAVLPEGAYTMTRMLNNYNELQVYLGHLSTALMNVGSAAQTVVDSYGGTDGWSATDLNAIEFAFGVPGAERPSGLPPMIEGTTYWDAYFDSLDNGDTAAPPAASPLWTDAGQRTNPDGSITRMATGPNGQRMEIRTYNVPDSSQTVTTTTIYAANGTQLSSSSTTTSTYLDGNTVVKRTTNPDGSTTEERTTYDSGDVYSHSTVNQDAEGITTSSTETVTNPDGSQTTTREDAEGEESHVVTIGEQTEGGSGTPDDPAIEAIDRIQSGEGW